MRPKTSIALAVVLVLAAALLGTLYVVYTRVLPGLMEPGEEAVETTGAGPESP
jgi:hypothetical protein